MEETFDSIYQVSCEKHPPAIILAKGFSFAAYRYYNHELVYGRPLKPFDIVCVTELSGTIVSNVTTALPFSTVKRFSLEEDTSFTAYDGEGTMRTVLPCMLGPIEETALWTADVYLPIRIAIPKYRTIRYKEKHGIKFGLTEKEIFSTHGKDPASAKLFASWVEIVYSEVSRLKSDMLDSTLKFSNEELYKFVGLERFLVSDEITSIANRKLVDKINDSYANDDGRAFFEEVASVFDWRVYKGLSVADKTWVAAKIGLTPKDVDEKAFSSFGYRQALSSAVAEVQKLTLEQVLNDILPF